MTEYVWGKTGEVLGDKKNYFFFNMAVAISADTLQLADALYGEMLTLKHKAEAELQNSRVQREVQEDTQRVVQPEKLSLQRSVLTAAIFANSLCWLPAA